ncbi:MAG: hypothetical protein IKC13_00120 [Elusimicrobiaceae bacterium]|nr:hypothetical protein [Elusimicrobiaceae bacterium]
MKKRIKYCAVALLLLGGSVCGGCAAVHNAAVCRIRFDYQDPALAQLSTHNLRALVSYRRLCP